MKINPDIHEVVTDFEAQKVTLELVVMQSNALSESVVNNFHAAAVAVLAREVHIFANLILDRVTKEALAVAGIPDEAES